VIVVTAAGGRTGAAVVRALWARGRRVRALVGSSRPRPEVDHYRAHGFTGSPRVLEALLGRPARTFVEHLDALDLPATAGDLR
jgi:hypothetical protein